MSLSWSLSSPTMWLSTTTTVGWAGPIMASQMERLRRKASSASAHSSASFIFSPRALNASATSMLWSPWRPSRIRMARRRRSRACRGSPRACTTLASTSNARAVSGLVSRRASTVRSRAFMAFWWASSTSPLRRCPSTSAWAPAASLRSSCLAASCSAGPPKAASHRPWRMNSVSSRSTVPAGSGADMSPMSLFTSVRRWLVAVVTSTSCRFSSLAKVLRGTSSSSGRSSSFAEPPTPRVQNTSHRHQRRSYTSHFLSTKSSVLSVPSIARTTPPRLSAASQGVCCGRHMMSSQMPTSLAASGFSS
mmetsp:Transcript_70016/g.221896  ORF Transcript_70016/g.221896 Transcript_70016/m.221896 type:complete len:306 (+) Transcript_70016:735-1652(+)